MSQIRLNKFLAQCGIASRRRCDLLIQQGLVSINGVQMDQLGTQIDPDHDDVEYDGKRVSPQTEIMIMLNKPIGYLVTASDPHGRATIFDLITGITERLFPVGRLDYNTEGLLILTNWGKLAHKLSHPKYNVRKTYRALVLGVPSPEILNQLRDGVELDDGLTAPAKVRLISSKNKKSWVEIKIHEGRKRQIRRMGEAVGHPVIELKRIAVDRLRLGSLALGKWRYLTPDEIAAFKRRVNYAA